MEKNRYLKLANIYLYSVVRYQHKWSLIYTVGVISGKSLVNKWTWVNWLITWNRTNLAPYTICLH